MNSFDLDRLIAMLDPQCDEKTLAFVRSEITAYASVPSNTLDADQSRSDQQKVDVFESPLFNDHPLTGTRK